MTATASTPTQARLQKIADRLREFSTELEDLTEALPEGPTCNALFASARNIDEAAAILEQVRLA